LYSLCCCYEPLLGFLDWAWESLGSLGRLDPPEVSAEPFDMLEPMVLLDCPLPLGLPAPLFLLPMCAEEAFFVLPDLLVWSKGISGSSLVYLADFKLFLDLTPFLAESLYLVLNI